MGLLLLRGGTVIEQSRLSLPEIVAAWQYSIFGRRGELGYVVWVAHGLVHVCIVVIAVPLVEISEIVLLFFLLLLLLLWLLIIILPLLIIISKIIVIIIVSEIIIVLGHRA